MVRRTALASVLLGLAASSAMALVTSCAGAPRPAPATAPPAPRTRAASERGTVALQVIPDPTAKPPKLADREEFVPPAIIGTPLLPAYPPEALEAHAAHAFVVVRITIDTDGRVAKIEDSPVLASSPSPFAAEFRAAVVRAVRRWRFTPGVFQQFEDGPDLDGDGKPDYQRNVRTDAVDVFYDVRFDFEIVKGEGRTRSSLDA